MSILENKLGIHYLLISLAEEVENQLYGVSESRNCSLEKFSIRDITITTFMSYNLTYYNSNTQNPNIPNPRVSKNTLTAHKVKESKSYKKGRRKVFRRLPLKGKKKGGNGWVSWCHPLKLQVPTMVMLERERVKI